MVDYNYHYYNDKNTKLLTNNTKKSPVQQMCGGFFYCKGNVVVTLFDLNRFLGGLCAVRDFEFEDAVGV
ncbi:MAG: hypothetical protein II480_14530, partial [Bacteroidales bacterium]|nr:hypothetical protein [Bacteroidales bacterium]